MRRNFIRPIVIVLASHIPVAVSAQQYPAEPPAANANTAAPVKVGGPVYDPAGQPVGSIAALEAGMAVLNTGSVNVRIPLDAIGHSAKGHVIAMSKAEIEAAAKKSTTE